MKMLDLFAGVGGFSLAGHWMGWETVAFVEWDKYCQKVLKKNFPNIPMYGDIKDYKGERGSADIVCGGFPCQPFSLAGKRKGTDDDRYLWPEMLRVIREVQPAYVVGENVAGLLTVEDGKTLGGIFTDLEDSGYEVESFIIPACSVGAWHRRDRIWIVAYSNVSYTKSISCNSSNKCKSEKQKIQKKRFNGVYEGGTSKDVSDTDSTRREIYGGIWKRGAKERFIKKEINEYDTGIRTGIGKPEPGMGRVVDGLSYWLDEPEGIPRVAKGVKDRVSRLKALGNAIVPQVAFEIFRAIDNNYKPNHP